MSDRNLNVRVEAKTAGDIKKPFVEAAAAADKASSSVKGYGAQLGGLKKGLDRVQGGLLGLSVSAGVLPNAVGKAVVSLNALGSATSVLKGFGMAGGALGVGGGPLALLAAGVAALGAAAVIASPKLQDSLGKAIYDVSDAAKEAEARMKRMKAAADEVVTARRLGGATLGEEEKSAQEHGVRAPFESKTRSLREQQARLNDRAAAAGQFPGDDLQASLAEEQAALKRAGGDAERLRGVRGEQGQRGRDVARRGDEAAARDEAKKVQAKIDAENAAYGEGVFASQDDANKHSKRLDALQGEKAGHEAEERRLAKENAGLKGKDLRPVTAADREDTTRQLDEATDRQRASAEKILDIKKKIGEAEIKNLTTLKEQAAEQAKVAEQAIKEEESKLRATKIGLGLSSVSDQARSLAISRKIAGGQELNQGEIQFAKGQDVFKGSLDKIGEQRADASPIIKEILQNLGAEAKLNQAKDAQAEALKVEADFKNQIEIKLTANAADMAKEIAERLQPLFEQGVKDQADGMAQAVAALERQRILAEQQKKANQNAGS